MKYKNHFRLDHPYIRILSNFDWRYLSQNQLLQRVQKKVCVWWVPLLKLLLSTTWCAAAKSKL